MHYLTGNILDFIGRPDAICITTNGFSTQRGAVMGMGIAKAYSDRNPEAPRLLRAKLLANGNIVQEICKDQGTAILAFPVKPVKIIMSSHDEVVSHARSKYRVGSSVPGFHCVADPAIISRSCKELMAYADVHKYRHIVLPIPGCGAGELSFNNDGIRAICESLLDSRFYMMSFKQDDFRR